MLSIDYLERRPTVELDSGHFEGVGSFFELGGGGGAEQRRRSILDGGGGEFIKLPTKKIGALRAQIYNIYISRIARRKNKIVYV